MRIAYDTEGVMPLVCKRQSLRYIQSSAVLASYDYPQGDLITVMLHK